MYVRFIPHLAALAVLLGVTGSALPAAAGTAGAVTLPEDAAASGPATSPSGPPADRVTGLLGEHPADPDGTVALLVQIDGPSLWDLYAGARDRAVATGAEAVVPTGTLATWRDAVAGRQAAPARAITALGADVERRYQAALNALLVRATPAQAPAIAAMPGVVAVTRAPRVSVALDRSVPHIGVRRVQDDLKLKGEGTLVAVIDSGIDYTHATFGGPGTAEAFADNDPGFVEDDFPTEKVEGGMDFAGPYYSPNCPPPAQLPEGALCEADATPDDDPLDEMHPLGVGGQGHGTHVGGIVAGVGAETPEGGIAVPPGVAPAADLVALKIFGNPIGMPPTFQGSTDYIVDAFNWVIEHNLGLDVQGWPAEDGEGNRRPIEVINMSVGGPWGSGLFETKAGFEDPVSIIVRNLVDGGVTTIISAGNQGNTPYITGAPAAAEMAVSVASSFADGEVDVSEIVAAYEDQVKNIAATTPAGAMTASFSDLPPQEDLPMAWYGLACNDDMTGEPVPPVQPVEGKVALIERGNCNFSVKVANAGAFGAIGVVIFTNANPVSASGTWGSGCWPDPLCADIPAVMIARNEGLALQEKLLADVEVRVSFPVAPQPQLSDTISDFSSRGPDRARGGVKPQVTAPGSNIQSAYAGTGYGGLSIGGTSMSSPTVAGVAALLWQRNREQSLGLDAAEIGALLLNYAEPSIHAEGDNARPLVGVPRQGAGLVDAFASAEGTTVVRSDRGIAELGFGDVFAADEPVVRRAFLTVKNFGDAAKTYKLDSRLMFDNDLGKGVSLRVEPAELTVASGGVENVAVDLTVDPSALPNWTLTIGQGRVNALANAAGFETVEVDGAVRIVEVDDAGNPVEGGDAVGVPFVALPHRASCVAAEQSGPIDPAAGRVPHPVANPCAQPGAVTPYVRLGVDPAEAYNPGPVNIENVGVRWYTATERDPAFPTVPLQVLEFAVQTSGSRRIPLNTEFHVYFDVDRDGKWDKVGWNVQNNTQWVTLLGRMFPGTLTPDITTAVDANGSAYINFQTYNIGETTAVLRFFANHPLWGVGVDLAQGGKAFDFAVSAADRGGDHPLGDDFLGYDLAPDNLEDGIEAGMHADAAYRFDQAVVDCVDFVDGSGQPVGGGQYFDFMTVPARGRWDGLNVAVCAEHRAAVEAAGAAVMTHYLWNAPGENVEIRPIGLARSFLPFAAQSFDFERAPAEPTAEAPEPTAAAPEPTATTAAPNR